MHLSEKAIAAGLALQNAIVPYTRFEALVDTLLLNVQLSQTMTFTGARVTAPSGCGKTALLAYINSRLQTLYDDGDSIPMIGGSLKESPSVSQIQGELLSRFHYPLKPPASKTNSDVNEILVRAIRRHRVRLIAIDEFQHIFLSKGNAVVAPVIDWLKRLMNMTHVPVILVGTERLEALDDVDPQLTTRITTKERLEPFQLNAEWNGFLSALAKACQHVDMSPAIDGCGKLLFQATGGTPRLIKALLVRALTLAVTNEEKQLSKATLSRAYELCFGKANRAGNPFATT